jgi:hypothetical protein
MTATSDTASSPAIRSLVPARIDRLPWSRFHTRMVTALGIAWILDGLEITIASNVGPDLTLKSTLHMSAGAVADIATCCRSRACSSPRSPAISASIPMEPCTDVR